MWAGCLCELLPSVGSCPSAGPGVAVPWGCETPSGQPCTLPVAEAGQQRALSRLRPSMANGVEGKQGASWAVLPAPARCLWMWPSRCSPGHSVGQGSVPEPGAARERGSGCGRGFPAGPWARAAGVTGRAVPSCTRALAGTGRGAWPPGRVFPGAACPQTPLLTHLGCRWGRMGLTQPRMRTRRDENRMWCAELGRKLLGAPRAPQPWGMVGAGSRAQRQPLLAPGLVPTLCLNPVPLSLRHSLVVQGQRGPAGGLGSGAARLWAEGPRQGFQSPSFPCSRAGVLGAGSPSHAAEQDLAESRWPRLTQPLQAADSGTGTCQAFAPAAGTAPRALDSDAVVPYGEVGSIQGPWSRGARQWGATSRGASITSGPGPGPSSGPVWPRELPWSLQRAAGTGGPCSPPGPARGSVLTACAGPGPAVGVWQSCTGELWGRGGPHLVEGRGPQHCRSELKMCQVECPGQPPRKEGGACLAGPQLISSPNGPGCPVSQPGGSRGVKALAGPGWLRQEQGVAGASSCEAGMTPRRPQSSLAPRGPDSPREAPEAPGRAGIGTPAQQHLSGATGTASGAGGDSLPGWCSGRRAAVSPDRGRGEAGGAGARRGQVGGSASAPLPCRRPCLLVLGRKEHGGEHGLHTPWGALLCAGHGGSGGRAAAPAPSCRRPRRPRSPGQTDKSCWCVLLPSCCHQCAGSLGSAVSSRSCGSPWTPCAGGEQAPALGSPQSPRVAVPQALCRAEARAASACSGLPFPAAHSRACRPRGSHLGSAGRCGPALCGVPGKG